MRNKLLSIPGIALVVILSGCKKDNYDPPTSMLTGRVTFQGQPVGVRSNAVQLELWQSGYQLFSKIPVFVAQDGTFSAALFNGNYKLTRLRGNGPWANNTDTINVTVNGAATVDVPVDPYFVIRNEQIQKSGSTITATFTVQQATTGRSLEAVRLFLGPTLIVDQQLNSKMAEKTGITDLSQSITLTADIPADLAGKDYLFARVGVKAVDVPELLYTQSRKIALK